MRPPRIYTALRDKFANATKSPEAKSASLAAQLPEARQDKSLSEPTRPAQIRAPGWDQDPGRGPQETSAIKTIKYKAQLNAQLAAARGANAPTGNLTGKASVRTDIDKERVNPPAQSHSREHAPAPQAQLPKGKAGVRADLQKARESVTAHQTPQGKGHGR